MIYYLTPYFLEEDMPLADKYRPARDRDTVIVIIGRGKLLNNMIEKAY